MTVRHPPNVELDDAALMLRVQADDADAFGELYDRFAARALRAAYAHTHDRAQAEDVVQAAFLAVWRSRARYRPASGPVDGWVMEIVQHGADGAPAGEDPGAAAKREEAERLRATLARLPAAQREVIALAYFGARSTSEIAAELDLPLGTVKGRMRLGLDRLRAGADPPPEPAA